MKDRQREKVVVEADNTLVILVPDYLASIRSQQVLSGSAPVSMVNAFVTSPY
jgi:hypothetical protein